MLFHKICAQRIAHQRLNSEFWGTHIALCICMVEFGVNMFDLHNEQWVPAQVSGQNYNVLSFHALR